MNLHEEIAVTAYGLFETRGREDGFDLDDWLNAEKLVLAVHAGQDMEEPEENGQEEMAGVGAKMETRRWGKAEDEEPVNEEMS